MTQKDKHKHTLRRAFKKTRVKGHEAWYFLMYVCTTCPHTETYDLTNIKPTLRGEHVIKENT